MADGFDFIAEELAAVGMLNAERVYVEDAAAQAELPDAVDGCHAIEATGDPVRAERVEVAFLPHLEDLRAQFEGMGWDQRIEQGRGWGDDDGWFAAHEPSGSGHAQADNLGVRGLPVVDSNVPSGEVMDDLFTGDDLEVVAPLLGSVLVGRDDEDRAFEGNADVAGEQRG